MARKNWEGRVGQEAEKAKVEKVGLTTRERKERILREAESRGLTTATIAMLGMVRTVDGFENMGTVFATPDRTSIDSERIRGAKNEDQARARAWRKLEEQRRSLDLEMPQKQSSYAHPSDWVRLFAALRIASKPDGNVPGMFAVQNNNERAAFRKWADTHALNGDGLIHAAQTIRQSYEDETGRPFDVNEAIQKIQTLTADELDIVIRAGFETKDTYIHCEEGGYVPLEKLPLRFQPSEMALRTQSINEEVEKRLQATATDGMTRRELDELRARTFRQVAERYDAKRFDMVMPHPSSIAHETPIVAGNFASISKQGDVLSGSGYHGIIQPDLLAILPKEYLQEEKSAPYVRRHDGKTVVSVQRWLMHKDGIPLLSEERVIESAKEGNLEQAATRKIADAIVYGKRDDRPWNPYDESLNPPYYWSDVHWTYKRLTEDRLPFLARLANVDQSPIAAFTDEDAEKEWLHNKVLATHVTTAKQLNDQQKHFELQLEDVYPEGPDREALLDADREYPLTIQLGGHAFSVEYEWNKEKTAVTKAIIPITKQGFYGNSYRLKYAIPTEIPQLGNPEQPLEIVFRYTERSEFHEQKREFPASRFRELLELVEPQERMIESHWDDFVRSEKGKLNIPLTITPQDRFPTDEDIALLSPEFAESVVFATDRDGKEHRAYKTIQHINGSEYRLAYVDSMERAKLTRKVAERRHEERRKEAQERQAMDPEIIDQKRTEAQSLQVRLEAYNQEFEQDNLVAFVLGNKPYKDETKKHLEQSLAENNFEQAIRDLRHEEFERQQMQDLINTMRKLSDTITELETLGFDWDRYVINKRTGQEYRRKDREGFYPGEIRLRKEQVYRPSMGRSAGYPMHHISNYSLDELQRRLDYELELWRKKKQTLRDERTKKDAEAKKGAAEPEIIRRGRSADSEDEET